MIDTQSSVTESQSLVPNTLPSEEEALEILDNTIELTEQEVLSKGLEDLINSKTFLVWKILNRKEAKLVEDSLLMLNATIAEKKQITDIQVAQAPNSLRKQMLEATKIIVEISTFTGVAIPVLPQLTYTAKTFFASNPAFLNQLIKFLQTLSSIK